MKETKLDPLWKQAAIEASQEFAYGETIPHEWIRDSLELSRDDQKMTHQQFNDMALESLRKIEAFKDEMLNVHCRYLVSVRGVGYKVIEPPHQTSAAMKKCHNEIRRSMTSAMKALVNVNESMLSLEETQENSEARGKLAYLASIGQRKLVGNE